MMSLSPNLPPDKQREMLRQMLMIRRFEERASADYLAGKIRQIAFLALRHALPTMAFTRERRVCVPAAPCRSSRRSDDTCRTTALPPG